MILTRNEKMATVCTLTHMMNADNNIDINEALLFTSIQHHLSITEEEFQTGKDMNLLFALTIIRDMPDEKKLLVGGLITEMMKADGKIDTRELKLFALIAEACKFQQLIDRL